MRIARTSTTLLALAALALAQGAEARKKAPQCITETEVVALIQFALPDIIKGAADQCRAHLAPDGFIATAGAGMVTTYSAPQDAAWPGARSAFMKLGGGEDDSALDGISDEALKPMAAELFARELLEKIPPEKCAGVERVLESAANIEPQSLAQLFGSMLAMIIGPKDKEMPICQA